MLAGLVDDGSNRSHSGNRPEQNQLATPLVTSGRNAHVLSTPVLPDRQMQLDSLTAPIQVHGGLLVASVLRPGSASVLKDRLFSEMESSSTAKTEAKAQTATESLATGFERNELSHQSSQLEALDAFFAKYQ